ncbi:MAG TPA: nucleoside-diphosphate sugar epimerase/dehydratase [Vicinamibacterales bacterium]|nr:nucleoside-diphosphate sugar epimerase/dehydratase [Vicinamibacterales bacterium]
MRNRYVLIGDLTIFATAALGAFVLRLDWFFASFREEFELFLLTSLTVKPAAFMAMGMYKRYWRYTTIGDLMGLCVAVLGSSAAIGVIAAVALYTGTVEQFSRSIVLIDGVLTLLGTAAFRVAIRVIGESRARTDELAGGKVVAMRRVLVVGAGDAGMMVVREMQRNPHLGMEAIGFIDDDATKIGKRIYGLPIFGRSDALAAVVKRQRIDEVTIAMPTAPGRLVRRIHDLCQQAGVPSRSVPGMFELLDGNVSVNRLRKVEISDLLRRSQVDWRRSNRAYLKGETVLVTGGGGSIGFELCRQVAYGQPASITLLGHGENSLFEAEAQLRESFPNVRVRVAVADIRDRDRVARLFAEVRPHVVFHAAAHKHVPMMEDNPEEAISNNVLGTMAVVDAAIASDTKHFVLISTDKAVAPTNIMGASKRIAEAIVRRAARTSGRHFVVVRFGNVLGSRGSAVPIFTRQIERGGPVTITDPEMRRFFMTIPEAVHLVLEAGGLGAGGELFVLRMGEPVRIVDLVQDLIRLSGADDVAITYTGIRPGEKLFENLWDDGALVDSTRHPEIVAVTEAQIRDDELQSGLDALERAVRSGDRDALLRGVTRLVPTFRRDGSGLDTRHVGVTH